MSSPVQGLRETWKVLEGAGRCWVGHLRKAESRSGLLDMGT